MIKYNKRSVSLDYRTYSALYRAAVQTLHNLQINHETRNDEYSNYFSPDGGFVLAVRKDDVDRLQEQCVCTVYVQ